jgi:hypothetical protein
MDEALAAICKGAEPGSGRCPENVALALLTGSAVKSAPYIYFIEKPGA